MPQDVLDLALYLVHALLAIHQVLEVATTQGECQRLLVTVFWNVIFHPHLFAV